MFNLELKSKLKSYALNEDIVFWKWLDAKTIGIVTELNVYRWSIDGDSIPTKIFDRHASLSGCQIINLRASSDEKWYVLVGISQRDNRVVGSMQLYSKERGVSQPIEGHAAAFAELHLPEAVKPIKLFTFAVRSFNGVAKVKRKCYRKISDLLVYKSCKSSKLIIKKAILLSRRKQSKFTSLQKHKMISQLACKSVINMASSFWLQN